MKKFRIILDLVMVILLPILMGYSLVGELYHEIVGVSMGVLCRRVEHDCIYVDN